LSYCPAASDPVDNPASRVVAGLGDIGYDHPIEDVPASANWFPKLPPPLATVRNCYGDVDSCLNLSRPGNSTGAVDNLCINVWQIRSKSSISNSFSLKGPMQSYNHWPESATASSQPLKWWCA